MAAVAWKQRWREMVLAGGAVATAACGSSPAGSSFQGGDATTDDGNYGDSSGNDVVTGNPCCNGSPDPCCKYQYCGASLTVDCVCELEGGTWSWNTGCKLSHDAGDAEAAPPDGAARDGGADAEVDADAAAARD